MRAHHVLGETVDDREGAGWVHGLAHARYDDSIVLHVRVGHIHGFVDVVEIADAQEVLVHVLLRNRLVLLIIRRPGIVPVLPQAQHELA